MADLRSLVRPALVASVALFKDKRVLLVQRGREPFSGSWSFPGGRVQPGEHLEKAAERELAEETGTEAASLHYVCPVEIIKKDSGILKYHIVLSLFTGYWQDGTPLAQDDAQDVRWAHLEELKTLHITDGLHKYAEQAWQKLVELKL